jgi:hypothetical protein
MCPFEVRTENNIRMHQVLRTCHFDALVYFIILHHYLCHHINCDNLKTAADICLNILRSQKLLTSASERSERTRSWEPLRTAASASSQRALIALSREPSRPLRILKYVESTLGFNFGSFNRESSSPSFSTGLDRVTWEVNKMASKYYSKNTM